MTGSLVSSVSGSKGGNDLTAGMGQIPAMENSQMHDVATHDVFGPTVHAVGSVLPAGGDLAGYAAPAAPSEVATDPYYQHSYTLRPVSSTGENLIPFAYTTPVKSSPIQSGL